MVTVQILLNVMYTVTGFFSFIILIMLWNKRIDIHSFFYPQKYNEIEMLEADNSTNIWIQRKNSDLTFDFNEGKYEMFHTNDKGEKTTNVYKSGRLGKFFYIEGDIKPKDFRQEFSTQSQEDSALSKIELTRLFEGNPTKFEEFWQKFAPIIIIGFLIVIIYIVSSNNGAEVIPP